MSVEAIERVLTHVAIAAFAISGIISIIGMALLSIEQGNER
jgi:hypothetical protein